MTARINIVHKLYDRKGDVSRYMMKNGHGAPDEYRVYDAEGNFLYGIVDRQPWTVFRILDRDGSLIYVGLTRSKHLKKRLRQLNVSGTLVKEEYPSRQHAEDAEKRYVRQNFPNAQSGDLLVNGQMLVMRTTEDPADSICELVSAEQSLGLCDLAFGVDPLGLYGVEPRALDGQRARYYPNPLAACFELAVVGVDPSSHPMAFVPACVVPDQKQGLFAHSLEPLAAPLKKLRGVMSLTGLPSTNLSQLCASSGR